MAVESGRSFGGETVGVATTRALSEVSATPACLYLSRPRHAISTASIYITLLLLFFMRAVSARLLFSFRR